jgi:N-acetylmuramic acid 6-phosphate etherase
MSPHEKTKSFLAISSQFQLGHLITESFHPDTKSLSQVAKENLRESFALLQEVDRKALELSKNQKSSLWKMAWSIQDTLKSGNKVFMCGCGATGRLSLVLETLFRQKFGNTDKVISFMAGGDFALIKSVESFEDRTEYGERQLMELGFGPHDLLLAPTEGGETPFVIGACNQAARISSRSPHFLYCNPDELLMPIERSREVLENHKIHKVNLTVGPMAISGSTRMQASTVLMLAIGVGLLYEHHSIEDFSQFYDDFILNLLKTPYENMAPLTSLEAKLYQQKKYLNYLADPDLAISVLTDTTERSPTFSLKGFENRLDEGKDHSLSYLFISEAQTSGHAWSELLKRAPRALEWSELSGRIGLAKVLSFDISSQGQLKRTSSIPCVNFHITQKAQIISFQCEMEEVSFSWGLDPLFNHLMVKMLLNAHSTLIMGLMDRYEGNVMTWVRPSNNKLIDRAARYTLRLLEQKGIKASYPEIINMIFEEMETLNENEAVVLKVLSRF